MLESRSHLIRIKGGGVRVLRLFAGATTYALRYDVPRGVRMCRHCGCTDVYGCAGGCAWISPTHDLCSRCHTKGLLR
jgi:hypothetical protein